MKASLRTLSILALGTAALFACSKTENHSSVDRPLPSPMSLTLSESSVQRGQALIASLPTGTSSSQIKWAVIPSAGSYISSSSGQAMILFANPGQYRVTAAYAADSVSPASDSVSVPVTVTDSIFQQPQAPPPASDTFSLSGDQINITPMFDSSGQLVLLAKTSNLYGCFPGFVVTMPFDGVNINGPGSINIGFAEVITVDHPGVSCNGAENPALAYLFVRDWIYGTGAQHYPSDGNYPMSIWVNGKPYFGSLTITGRTYSFSWTYTSGVVISPQVVKRS